MSGVHKMIKTERSCDICKEEFEYDEDFFKPLRDIHEAGDPRDNRHFDLFNILFRWGYIDICQECYIELSQDIFSNISQSVNRHIRGK